MKAFSVFNSTLRKPEAPKLEGKVTDAHRSFSRLRIKTSNQSKPAAPNTSPWVSSVPRGCAPGRGGVGSVSLSSLKFIPQLRDLMSYHCLQWGQKKNRALPQTPASPESGTGTKMPALNSTPVKGLKSGKRKAKLKEFAVYVRLLLTGTKQAELTTKTLRSQKTIQTHRNQH